MSDLPAVDDEMEEVSSMKYKPLATSKKGERFLKFGPTFPKFPDFYCITLTLFKRECQYHLRPVLLVIYVVS
jgi:hypothetical protein